MHPQRTSDAESYAPFSQNEEKSIVLTKYKKQIYKPFPLFPLTNHKRLIYFLGVNKTSWQTSTIR